MSSLGESVPGNPHFCTLRITNRPKSNILIQRKAGGPGKAGETVGQFCQRGLRAQNLQEVEKSKPSVNVRIGPEQLPHTSTSACACVAAPPMEHTPR